MWLLKDDSGALTYLKPNETLTVGRNKGDIILTNDQSISRVHAKITIKPVPDTAKIDDNTAPLSTCTVEDANSKYGSFIIKDGGPHIKITEGGYMLRHMDRIRFGLQNYIFTALYVPIITLTSGLTETEKNQLTKIIDAIGGKIMYAWTPICTHMTIETPTISKKLSCALAYGTPIVSIDYWKAALKAFQNNEIFPETVQFAASINNKMINLGRIDVTPNPMRKKCFENLTFVHFTSEQYNTYNLMIKLAGGTSIKYGRQQSDLDVCNDNVIVVQLIESNTTQATGTGDVNYAAVCEQLGMHNRRTIPESEIPLAILNCLTEKYCNPRYSYAQLFTNRQSEMPQKNSSILALDTQEEELPTTSGVQRHAQSDVKESVEYSYPINDMSESTAGSSYDSDAIGSMKLVSLNYEKNLENDLKKKSALAENSLKRGREENIKIDATNKRVCLDISVCNEEHSQQPGVSHKLQVSNRAEMSGDEDICFVDEKISIIKEPERRKVTPGAIHNSSIKDMAAPILPESKRRAQSSRIRGFESEERSFLKAGDGDALRKRKMNSFDISPSLEVIENPLNHHEPKSNSGKDIFRVPQQKASNIKIYPPPSKQLNKMELDADDWNEKKVYKTFNDSGNKSYGSHDVEVSVFFPSRNDPNNTSAQRLLRIVDTDDLADSAVPKFGKCFRKRYTVTPRRVDLYDASDDVSWSGGVHPQKDTSFNDEQATISRYLSSNTSGKSNKMLRV